MAIGDRQVLDMKTNIMDSDNLTKRPDAYKYKINSLIKRYELKINDKKRLNEKLRNDIIEGIIISLEDVVLDLKAII